MNKSQKISGLSLVAALILASCSGSSTGTTSSTTTTGNESLAVAINTLFSGSSQQGLTLQGGEQKTVCDEGDSGPTGVSTSISVVAGHYGTETAGYDITSAASCTAQVPLHSWQIVSPVVMDCQSGNVTFEGGEGVFLDDGIGNTQIYGQFSVGGANFFCDVVITHNQDGTDDFNASCEDSANQPVAQTTTNNSCTTN